MVTLARTTKRCGKGVPILVICYCSHAHPNCCLNEIVSLNFSICSKMPAIIQSILLFICALKHTRFIFTTFALLSWSRQSRSLCFGNIGLYYKLHWDSEFFLLSIHVEVEHNHITSLKLFSSLEKYVSLDIIGMNFFMQWEWDIVLP